MTIVWIVVGVVVVAGVVVAWSVVTCDVNEGLTLESEGMAGDE